MVGLFCCLSMGCGMLRSLDCTFDPAEERPRRLLQIWQVGGFGTDLRMFEVSRFGKVYYYDASGKTACGHLSLEELKELRNHLGSPDLKDALEGAALKGEGFYDAPEIDIWTAEWDVLVPVSLFPEDAYPLMQTVTRMALDHFEEDWPSYKSDPAVLRELDALKSESVSNSPN